MLDLWWISSVEKLSNSVPNISITWPLQSRFDEAVQIEEYRSLFSSICLQSGKTQAIVPAAASEEDLKFEQQNLTQLEPLQERPPRVYCSGRVQLETSCCWPKLNLPAHEILVWRLQGACRRQLVGNRHTNMWEWWDRHHKNCLSSSSVKCSVTLWFFY